MKLTALLQDPYTANSEKQRARKTFDAIIKYVKVYIQHVPNERTRNRVLAREKKTKNIATKLLYFKVNKSAG